MGSTAGSDQNAGVRGGNGPMPSLPPLGRPGESTAFGGSTAVPSTLATSSLLSRTPRLQASTQHHPGKWVLLLRACTAPSYLPPSAGCPVWVLQPPPARSDVLSGVPALIYPREGLLPLRQTQCPLLRLEVAK